jgi:hypothetical protein
LLTKINPITHHCLELRAETRPNKVPQQTPLHLIRPIRIKARPTWHAAPDQSSGMARHAPHNFCTTRIAPANMRPHRAAPIVIKIKKAVSETARSGFGVSGDSARGTPLRQRPHKAAATTSRNAARRVSQGNRT